MKLHQLVGATLVASDEARDRLFFWNGDGSLFLFQGGAFRASRRVAEAGSLAHARDAAQVWSTLLVLCEQVVVALVRRPR